jgi:branched-chain amino acid transport system permease protein
VDRTTLRWSVRAGVIGGVTVLYFCAVGMVETFSTRNLVGSQVTLGKLLVWIPPIVAGFAAGRPKRGVEAPIPLGPGQIVASGSIGGAAAGVIIAIGIAIAEAFGVLTVRGVLVAVTPNLVAILTFHGSTLGGTGLLVLVAAIFGVAGAGLRLMGSLPRRMIVGGLSAVVLMGLLQRVVPTALTETGVSPDWLYDRILGGLTRQGAILTFAVTAGAIYAYRRWGQAVRAWYRTLRRPAGGGEGADRTAPVIVGLIVIFLPLAILALLPQILGSIVNDTLGFVGIGLMLALGLNIIVGNAGLLHLGFVVFFTIGAYATALLTGASRVNPLGVVPPVLPFHISFYLALPIVMVIAALVGILIAAPTVRLRGDYLAIVTLGFGAMASVLVQSDWLKNVLGGPLGLRDVPPAPLFGIEMRSPLHFYYLAAAACSVAVFVSWRLTSSRIGRAWNAMREDEQVAEAMGISVVRYKLLASAVGGALGAVGGALFAVKIGSLTSQSFTILVSITALAVIILGGLGSVRGAVLGAVVLIGLPNLLSEFEGYRLAIYGATLIAIMLFRPQGLLPNVRLARELREEERAQDQWLREHDPEVAEVAEAEAAAAIASDAIPEDPAPA